MDDYDGQDGIQRTEASDREVVRLWRAWRTVNEMCADRGYELSAEEVNISLDEFKAKYTDNGLPNRARMQFQAAPSDAMMTKFTPVATPNDASPAPQCGTVWVEFAREENMGIKQMRVFAQHIQSNNFHTGILVTRKELTNSAHKIITVVLPSIIETFHEQDLLVNITHHMLVPKHVLLSPAEKKKLLERYRVKETQLPRIQTSDSMARYLGLRRGQVVKIVRTSQTAGRYATYRWAI